jgi:hypothetical protein
MSPETEGRAVGEDEFKEFAQGIQQIIKVSVMPAIAGQKAYLEGLQATQEARTEQLREGFKSAFEEFLVSQGLSPRISDEGRRQVERKIAELAEVTSLEIERPLPPPSPEVVLRKTIEADPSLSARWLEFKRHFHYTGPVMANLWGKGQQESREYLDKGLIVAVCNIIRRNGPDQPLNYCGLLEELSKGDIQPLKRYIANG